MLTDKFATITLPMMQGQGPCRLQICVKGEERTRIKSIQRLVDGWANHAEQSFEVKDPTNLVLTHGTHQIAYACMIKSVREG